MVPAGMARLFGCPGSRLFSGMLTHLDEEGRPRMVDVTGKAVTPFLLGYIVDASGGRSLEVNLDLARAGLDLFVAAATARLRS